jgi:multisubunit Na+/H+ antiporter MnhC subunit
MTLSISAAAFAAVLVLLACGLYGLLVARSLIRIIVALQLLVKGAMVALLLAGRVNGQIQTAQSLALTVIVADTIVAVVALSLAVQVRKYFGSLDVEGLTTLRR